MNIQWFYTCSCLLIYIYTIHVLIISLLFVFLRDLYLLLQFEQLSFLLFAIGELFERSKVQRVFVTLTYIVHPRPLILCEYRIRILLIDFFLAKLASWRDIVTRSTSLHDVVVDELRVLQAVIGEHRVDKLFLLIYRLFFFLFIYFILFYI